jgi:hypothetical protein
MVLLQRTNTWISVPEITAGPPPDASILRNGNKKADLVQHLKWCRTKSAYSLMGLSAFTELPFI